MTKITSIIEEDINAVRKFNMLKICCLNCSDFWSTYWQTGSIGGLIGALPNDGVFSSGNSCNIAYQMVESFERLFL